MLSTMLVFDTGPTDKNAVTFLQNIFQKLAVKQIH